MSQNKEKSWAELIDDACWFVFVVCSIILLCHLGDAKRSITKHDRPPVHDTISINSITKFQK